MKNAKLCKTCRREFEYYLTPSMRKERIYCSIKCRDKDPEYNNPMKGKKRIDLSNYNKVHKKDKTWEELYGVEKAKKMKKDKSIASKKFMIKQYNEGKINHKREHNTNWKGGRSYEPYGYEFNKELKLAIKIRDNFKCKICGKEETDKKQLVIHHIDYNKENNNTDNLVTLCNPCHSKTNGVREKWIDYFLRDNSSDREYISWEEIEQNCLEIVKFLKDKEVTGVVPIPRGGIIPAIIITKYINVPIKFEVDNKKDIIVDEIVDFGFTLKKFKSMYPNNLFVCIHLNNRNFKLRIKPDFFVRRVNKFIVYPWEKDRKKAFPSKLLNCKTKIDLYQGEYENEN